MTKSECRINDEVRHVESAEVDPNDEYYRNRSSFVIRD